MMKRVIVAGLTGGAVMFAWLFVTNAMLPFKGNLIHRELPFEAQLAIHEPLKMHITDAGTYSIPYLSWAEEDQFPDYRSQPVYTVTYQEYAHSGEGGSSPMTSFPVILLAVFVPTLLAAWMLSLVAPAVASKYSRRVLFVAAIGLIIALADDVLQMSFGPQAVDYLTFLAVNNVLAWLVTGLVVAGLMKPARAV